MEFLHLLRYRTRASAQAIFELRVDPVIDRQRSRKADAGMGLGEALAPSLSHESPAAAGHCHSITDRVAYSNSKKYLLSSSFVTQRK